MLDKSQLKLEKFRTPNRIEKAIRIFRKYHLHLPGGLMKIWARHKHNIKTFVIVTYKNTPIGAGILNDIAFSTYSINTGIFVKDKYRRQGIGTEILKRLQTPKNPCNVGTGLSASIPFYTKHKTKFKLNTQNLSRY